MSIKTATNKHNKTIRTTLQSTELSFRERMNVTVFLIFYRYVR